MARRALCALALGLGAAQAAAETPTVRLWDGAVVLKPYNLTQLDMGTTFAHSRNGGPGAGVNLRRARLGVEAEILKDVEAAFIWEFGSTPGSPDRLYQASVAYKGFEPFTATVGVFKPHFSLERKQSSSDLLFVEPRGLGRRGIIEIELLGGKRVRIDRGADYGVRSAALRLISASHLLKLQRRRSTTICGRCGAQLLVNAVNARLPLWSDNRHRKGRS